MRVGCSGAGTIGILILAGLSWNGMPAFSQVGPAEIINPSLKAAEQAYMPQLTALNRAIAGVRFPFPFSLSRYAGLDPKDQSGADARGLEFVRFHDRLVLKATGNYNAAFSGELLTGNQRADRVFGDVIVPILRMLPGYFSSRDSFDAFGFEIAYHARTRGRGFEYEGKEILVLVMDKSDALAFGGPEFKRQEALNRSEIYLDGKPFGLAVGARDPFDVEALERSVRVRPAATAPPAVSGQSVAPAPGTAGAQVRPIIFKTPLSPVPNPEADSSESPPNQPASPSSRVGLDPDSLQRKYQSQLDELDKEGVAKHHFVEYAPPSFVVFRNQISLQLTLKNPVAFEKDATSIYKRAAQSFDLFLAPRLKPILDKLPTTPELSGLDATVINELTSKSGPASEAVEFIFPLQTLRRFVDAEITNQDLINQGLVLVNGVRIALDLQLVE